ncbi:MAG: MlaD family protein [Gemmatimonadota bacterium]|nr:MlaD family protein [Gemmatimonadota bacterium]MDH5760143.1 MlaD family protein [Gemmatimonadota bacterium]
MSNLTSGGGAHATDDEIRASLPALESRHEVRVGIFAIVGLISFLAVLFLLTDPATFRGRYLLVTTLDDAGGVRRGDPIQMRGVNLGRVHSFHMRSDGKVDLKMEVEGEWEIPVGSTAKLGDPSLFGGRTVIIDRREGTVYYVDGDTVPTSTGSGGGLLGSMDELTGGAGDLLEKLNTLMDPTTIESVQGAAGELEILLTQLSQITREQQRTLGTLTASLSRTAEGLEGAGPDAARVLARADTAMMVLAQTTTNLDAASASLQEIMARINAGEGTLGRLSTDSALYVNLNRAAESMALLLTDLQDNPKKYINVSIF